MKLEPIVQSEVSQKDKEHYSILKAILEGFSFCKKLCLGAQFPCVLLDDQYGAAAAVHVCSVMSDSLWPHGLYPTIFLSVDFSRQEYWTSPRILECFARRSSQPRECIHICIERWILYHCAT